MKRISLHLILNIGIITGLAFLSPNRALAVCAPTNLPAGVTCDICAPDIPGLGVDCNAATSAPIGFPSLADAVDNALPGEVICIADQTREPPIPTLPADPTVLDLPLCPDGTTIARPAHVMISQAFGAPFLDSVSGLIIAGCNTARVGPGTTPPLGDLIYICPGAGNIIIRDLEIGETGDDTAIVVDNTGTDVFDDDGTAIKSVKFVDNDIGVHLLPGADRHNISGSNAISNRVGFLIESELNLLRGNQAKENVENGFEFRNGQNNIRNNRADENGANGFDFDASVDNILHGNKARENAAAGFFFSADSGSNKLKSNQAMENGGVGYDMQSSLNTLLGNRAKENDEEGYRLAGGMSDYSRNKSEENSGDGYVVTGADSTFDRNFAKNNLKNGMNILSGENFFDRNQLRCNKETGLLVSDPGAGSENQIKRTLSCGNAVDIVTHFEYDVAANNDDLGGNKACNVKVDLELDGQVERTTRRSCFKGGTGSTSSGSGGGSGNSGDNKPPRCNMKADPRRGDAPLTVQFANKTKDPDGDFADMTFEWDFGDGSPLSTDVNPVHIYTQTGKHSVTIKATDKDNGVCTKEFRQVITVDQP